MATQSESYPARLDIDYPEKLDRLTTFFRLIWIIPIAIILGLISATLEFDGDRDNRRRGEVVSRATSSGGGIAAGLFGATLLMILFRQRYPRWWFDFAREFDPLRGPGRRLRGPAHRPVSVDRRGAVRAPRDRLPRRRARSQSLAAVGEVVPGHPALHRARRSWRSARSSRSSSPGSRSSSPAAIHGRCSTTWSGSPGGGCECRRT